MNTPDCQRVYPVLEKVGVGGEGEARDLVGHHSQHGVHGHQVGVVNQRGRPHPLPLIFTRHTHIAHITTNI